LVVKIRRAEGDEKLRKRLGSTHENKDRIRRKPNKISAFERRKWTAVVFASTHVQGCSKYVLQINAFICDKFYQSG
jgi:hypothetical protein